MLPKPLYSERKSLFDPVAAIEYRVAEIERLKTAINYCQTQEDAESLIELLEEYEKQLVNYGDRWPHLMDLIPMKYRVCYKEWETTNDHQR